jgi:rubrerythrin
VEEEAANLMIYLIGSAKFESEMSPGEKSELLDIISKFQNEGEKLEEADDRDKKIGVIGTIVASTLLFGIGGLLVSGIVFGLSKLSDKDFKKEKDDSDDIFDDVKSGKPDKSKLDKKKADLDSKPEGKPEPPKNLFQAIKQDIGKVKSSLIDKAKKTVDSINKKSIDTYQKGKDKVLGKDPKDMDSKEKKAAQAKDSEKLKPDQYKKKWGKCPKGWRWDSKQNACVKSKQKSESIIVLDDLIV